jgi:hypothetical protein
MLVDRKKRGPVSLKQGAVLSGSIEYKEASSNGRGLEVEVTWKEEEGKEHGKQMWYLQ